jgi:glycosyltransferase involved in cell wall biosynthesis
MKIVWLHSHFLNWMGGHKFVYEVVKRLNKKHDITLYTSIASQYSIDNFRQANIKFQILNNLSTGNPFYWLLLPYFIHKEVKRLKPLIVDADLVISSYFPANIWAYMTGKPHLQVCYEPLSFFYDEEFLSGYSLPVRMFFKFMKTLYGTWDKKAVLNAKGIVTLSQFNRKWINDIYGIDNVSISYEGVDTNLFKSSPNSNLQKKYKGYSIIFHSTDFTYTKGTDLLIKVLPKIRDAVPNVKLLITYTQNNLLGKAKIINLAKSLMVLENLELLGFVEYNLLPAYYSISDVVVQPSRLQSMSLSVKEGMSCGVPIVTCCEGWEQTKDGEAGFLVDTRDSNILAEKIIKLLKNKKLRLVMGAKGEKIIREKFSWESVAGKIESEAFRIISKYD